MLKRLLLGLLVLWAGVSLLAEARRALTSWDARAGWEIRPQEWRLGSPPVARLEACLGAARPLLPGGSNVAFVSGQPPDRAIYYTRWAAYLMPAQNVFSPGEGTARYVLSWQAPLAGPELARARLVRPLPGCLLYEAVPP
jgi:hypothetical protein